MARTYDNPYPADHFLQRTSSFSTTAGFNVHILTPLHFLRQYCSLQKQASMYIKTIAFVGTMAGLPSCIRAIPLPQSLSSLTTPICDSYIVDIFGEPMQTFCSGMCLSLV